LDRLATEAEGSAAFASSPFFFPSRIFSYRMICHLIFVAFLSVAKPDALVLFCVPTLVFSCPYVDDLDPWIFFQVPQWLRFFFLNSHVLFFSHSLSLCREWLLGEEVPFLSFCLLFLWRCKKKLTLSPNQRLSLSCQLPPPPRAGFPSSSLYTRLPTTRQQIHFPFPRNGDFLLFWAVADVSFLGSFGCRPTFRVSAEWKDPLLFNSFLFLSMYELQDLHFPIDLDPKPSLF